jgi:hypothetical protein
MLRCCALLCSYGGYVGGNLDSAGRGKSNCKAAHAHSQLTAVNTHVTCQAFLHIQLALQFMCISVSYHWYCDTLAFCHGLLQATKVLATGRWLAGSAHVTTLAQNAGTLGTQVGVDVAAVAAGRWPIPPRRCA